MSEQDNPLLHIEPVAAEALSRFYKDKEIPKNFPASIEQSVIGWSVAISLKRIADVICEPNEFGENALRAIGGALNRWR